MVTVIVNGIEVKVDQNATALQACESVGIEIPRFCFHERLSVAGNCRMCLVEIEKSPKPQASCAFPVMEGMKIYTDTPLVRKAREAVLEFLLINHPLDCPICDQGGECDLQDQAMNYGSDRSRFYGYKRSVENKNVGPLIKMIMTRCIHCTRCVRFMSEIAGVGDFGTTGRGTSTEIGTYIEKGLKSELSGNIIDLCPVGALTSKAYAFTARPWELVSTDSIDISDGVGSNIRVDSRGPEVVRVLPRCNEEINEEWISDKSRYACDGIKRQRLDTPMIRDSEGNLLKCSWDVAFNYIIKSIQDKHISFSFGPTTNLETLAITNYVAKNMPNEVNMDINYSNYSDLDSYFKLNQTIQGLENVDLCLLVGTNPRFEASMVNTRLRKQITKGQLKVAFIGSGIDSQSLTYDVTHLGCSGSTLKQITEGRHWYCSVLAKAKNPIIIYGSSLIQNDIEGLNYTSLFNNIKENLCIKGDSFINVLHLTASSTGALFLGVNTSLSDKASVIWSLGDVQIKNINNKFLIYQGHHGNDLAQKASVILPSSCYVESNSTFINTEGKAQQTSKILTAPGLARLDYQIIYAFYIWCINNFSKYKLLKTNLDIDSIINEHLNNLIPTLNISNSIMCNLSFTQPIVDYNSFVPSINYPFKSIIKDFYRTDNISNNSPTMAKCSTTLFKRENFV